MDTPIKFNATSLGYISGDTSYPLSANERDNGDLGYEAREWEAITSEEGGASRYPLRDNHGEECGMLLKTQVRYDTALRRPVCGVDALINLDTEAGRAAWQKVQSGEYRYLSHGFDAKPIPGTRRYKNLFREVSLVKTPAHPEAHILVRCSGEDQPDQMASTSSSSSAAAAAAAATTQAAPAAPMQTDADAPMQTDAAVPAVPPEAAEFLAKAPKDSKELPKFAYNHYVASAAEKKRAQELEAENARLREQAARLEEIEARERQKLLAEQQERRKTFTPLLQKGGMDVDAHTELVEELTQSQHTVPLFSALATVQQQHSDLEKRAQELEAENARLREQAEQAQTFMSFLNPHMQQAQQQQQARQPAQKRAVQKTEAPATEAPTSAAKRQLDGKTASLLNLDRLNKNAFSAAARAQQAATAVATSSSSSPSAMQTTEPVQAVGAGADDEDDDGGGINLPENLIDRLQMLYTLAERMPNAPVPVRCSKEDYEAIKPIKPEQTGLGEDRLPWATKMLFFGNQKEIDKMVSNIGYCHWRYDDKGYLRNEVEEARKARAAAHSMWMPHV